MQRMGCTAQLIVLTGIGVVTLFVAPWGWSLIVWLTIAFGWLSHRRLSRPAK
jgi:hypothetical protein